MTRVRLGTDDHRRYRVTLSWELDNLLAPLAAARELVLATLHPTLDVDEYELSFDDGSGCATNSGPTSPALLTSARSGHSAIEPKRVGWTSASVT